MKVRFQMFPYFFCLLDGPWLGSDGQSQSIGIFPLQSQRWTKSIASEASCGRVSDGQSQSIGILLLQFFFVPYIRLVKVYTIKIKTLDFFRRPRILFAN